METSTLLVAFGGGMLIGSAACGLLLLNGRIAGISGIVGGLFPPRPGETLWRLAFILGLVFGGVLILRVEPAAFGASPAPFPGGVLVAGLLVGLGAGLGNGCTSGHGVCGLGRRSLRSLIATISFMSSGAITVYVVNHLVPGN